MTYSMTNICPLSKEDLLNDKHMSSKGLLNVYVHSVKATYSMTNICPLSKGDLLNDKHMSTQ